MASSCKASRSAYSLTFPLARTSHGLSTAAADSGMSTALRSVGLLDVLSSTPAEPAVARRVSMPVCAASLRNPVRNAGQLLKSWEYHISIFVNSGYGISRNSGFGDKNIRNVLFHYWLGEVDKFSNEEFQLSIWLLLVTDITSNREVLRSIRNLDVGNIPEPAREMLFNVAPRVPGCVIPLREDPPEFFGCFMEKAN